MAAVDLDKVPLKYEGLDQWEIWVSESQERMTIAVDPKIWTIYGALGNTPWKARSSASTMIRESFN